MARKSLKEAILDAADRIIHRDGLANATIDAVAQEAGVSKGGLFYHFASKKEMLLRLVDRYEKRFFEQRAEILKTLPDSPAKLLKATIIASVYHAPRSNVSVSNILSLLGDSELRERVSQIKQKVFCEVVEGVRSPERIAIAILAADGMWVAEMFGAKSFDDSFKKRIIDELLRVIELHEHDAYSADLQKIQL